METRFIVVTADEVRFTQLNEAIKGLGVSVWLHWNSDVLVQLVGSMGASAVFIDYSHERLDEASALSNKLLSVYPQLWIVGFAPRSDSELIVEAMRSGARDFVELAFPADTIVHSLRLAMERTPGLPAQSSGKMISLLGARPGVGTTTAAAHLALLLKQEVMPDDRVLLLDFGYPAGDAALYLDTRVNFNFCDAVRSLRRLDQALLSTAFAHHKSGLSLLTLPQNLAELRDVSPDDAMTLLSMLKSYFRVVIVDLGGFAGTDLLLYALGVSDQTLLISEQSVASTYSARLLLSNFRERGVNTERIGLIAGKVDPRIELSPDQLAQHLELRLLLELPARPEKFIECANQGSLLLDVAPSDPYVQALRKLARQNALVERRAEKNRSESSSWKRKFKSWIAG